MNAVIQRQVSAYNSRPQTELGGLSPDQAARLLAGDWVTSGALRLNAALPLGELDDARIFCDAKTLLEYFRDAGPVKLTPAGNLPRKVVQALLPRLRTWSAESTPDEMAETRPLNEGDLLWLPVIRFALKLAKLVTGAARTTITRRGKAMLEYSQAGELYALLFRTLFQEVDLRAVDRFPGHDGLQSTVAYSLFKLRSFASEWRSPEQLAQDCWLPGAKDGISDWERQSGTDLRHWTFRGRVLRPLVEFGLLEVRELPGKDKWDRPVEMRKSPLFDRFFKFEF